MPWAGLTPPTWDLPANEQFAEMFGHSLWGLVIGVFYENFRRRWSKPIMASSDQATLGEMARSHSYLAVQVGIEEQFQLKSQT
jgi:hypothetical protein